MRDGLVGVRRGTRCARGQRHATASLTRSNVWMASGFSVARWPSPWDEKNSGPQEDPVAQIREHPLAVQVGEQRMVGPIVLDEMVVRMAHVGDELPAAV